MMSVHDAQRTAQNIYARLGGVSFGGASSRHALHARGLVRQMRLILYQGLRAIDPDTRFLEPIPLSFEELVRTLPADLEQLRRLSAADVHIVTMYLLLNDHFRMLS